jgi:hypothetical protein
MQSLIKEVRKESGGVRRSKWSREDQKGMMDIALNFYKHLFRKEDRPLSLSQDLWG